MTHSENSTASSAITTSSPAGPPFTIVNHTSEPGALDIEAVWPIDQAAAGAGRIHGGSLPTPLAGHPNPPSRAGRSEQDLAEVFL